MPTEKRPKSRCTDRSAALAAAARQIGVEHQAISAGDGQRAIGPGHIYNINGYHSRLKNWMRGLSGVASSYPQPYLGWFRALNRFSVTGSRKPCALFALALGI